MSKDVFWIVPDRETSQKTGLDQANFWSVYSRAAEVAGVRFGGVHSAEQVEIKHRSGKPPIVSINGHEATREKTIFVTSLYLFPHHMGDVWNHLATFSALEECGFYLPVPTKLAVQSSEKLATTLVVERLGVPVLDSTRFIAGRDLKRRDLGALTADLDFPIAVKPSNWAGGSGFNIANSPAELSNIMSLASGAEPSLLLQRCLAPSSLIDYRVVCIDLKPRAAWIRRPRSGSPVASMSRGGQVEFGEIPPKLADWATQVARHFAVPYLCVDFLRSGDEYYFSEIEPDGALDHNDPETERIFTDRFVAYSNWHDDWLARSPDRR